MRKPANTESRTFAVLSGVEVVDYDRHSLASFTSWARWSRIYPNLPEPGSMYEKKHVVRSGLTKQQATHLVSVLENQENRLFVERKSLASMRKGIALRPRQGLAMVQHRQLARTLTQLTKHLRRLPCWISNRILQPETPRRIVYCVIEIN